MPKLDRPCKYQGTIFVVDPSWGSASKLAKVVRELGAGFAELGALPHQLPQEAPAAIPRGIFMDVEGQRWEATVSLQRVDLRYFPIRETEPARQTGEREFWPLAAGFLAELADRFAWDVNRIAGVIELLGDTAAEGVPADALVRDRFLSPRLPLCLNEGPRDSEVHVYQRRPWPASAGTISLNEIVRVKALHTVQDPDNDRTIFLELDINTIQDDPNVRYSTRQVREFFSYLPSEIDRLKIGTWQGATGSGA